MKTWKRVYVSTIIVGVIKVIDILGDFAMLQNSYSITVRNNIMERYLQLLDKTFPLYKYMFK